MNLDYPIRAKTHQSLRVTIEIVVWISDTFDNNLEIKNQSSTYLKGS